MNLFPATIPWSMIAEISKSLISKSFTPELLLKVIYVIGCTLSYAIDQKFVGQVLEQMLIPVSFTSPNDPAILGEQLQATQDGQSESSVAEGKVESPAVVIGIITLALQVLRLFVKR